MVDKPTVISLFAGCGGSSLGYQMAGFKELLAVEWDDNAVATFRLNFPDVPAYHGDICKLSVDECLKLAGIKRGELDVLDGSPPCQGFSMAGKRKYNDPRNSLFKEFARLLDGLQPRAFVMENVAGLVKGVMKQAYLQIVKSLRECGYRVRGEVMNAMYFNVPQSRERVIVIGVREDEGWEPGHPRPKGRPITPREAFKDVPPEEERPLPGWLQEAARYMDAGNYSHMHMERAFMIVRGKSAGSINTKLLSWGRIACTLVKSEIAATGIIHPNRKRYLTIGEMKRLVSFPDEYGFFGTRKDVVARLGNSVPPNLMKAIAEHIKVQLTGGKAQRG